ncbi:CPBP family intramembrane glutamic endopeptidase [Burkholderia gladioli]|uniref:CPBP family intramembrane glutamic endopeptidase n=1 Tax=Burkholderia gladioli TaxID=28095 RepID=UPI001641B48C|nr:CPBP family intramembrane glutamic endopeptidase [Burkholderia gladioli]MDA0576435.1 CPBP family intramembrane metalloprotease [Burkholderia gladioli]MDA0604521.1 CPBP family intramembrane metalloprotease [Burkholderia gladioli]
MFNKNSWSHLLKFERLSHPQKNCGSLPNAPKFRNSTLWKIFSFISIFMLIDIGLTVILDHTLKKPHRNPTLSPTDALAAGLINLLAVISATAALAKIENKSLFDYGLTGAARAVRFLSGSVIGFVAISILMLALWKTGLVQIDRSGGQAWKYAGAWAIIFLLAAVFEELLLRGYLQVALVRRIGFWRASTVLSTIFGLLHATSPSENLVGMANAIVLGLILCLTLWYTGSLWWAIGFHAAWDWGESAVYGASDSGSVVQHAMFAARPLGSVLLSGGSAGPEGSLLILPLMGFIAVLIWLRWRPSPLYPR